MSRLFLSGGHCIGASASAPVLLMNIQNLFPLGLTGLISLLSKGLSRILSSTTIQKHQFFDSQPSSWSMTTGKIIALTRQLFASNVMSLLFNMLSRFVIALLFSCKEQKHTPFKSRRTDHKDTRGSHITQGQSAEPGQSADGQPRTPGYPAVPGLTPPRGICLPLLSHPCAQGPPELPPNGSLSPTDG